MAICKYYVLLETKTAPAVENLGAACLTVGTTLGVAPLQSSYPHLRCKFTKKF